MDGEQSWSEILDRIVSNVQEMIRSEVRLAKSEIKEGGQTAAKAGISLVAGAALAFYAGWFILLCIVYALTLVLAAWLSALIVGAVLALAAFLALRAGVNKLRRVQKPVRTIESVRETVEWAKNQGN
jgi:uncharacterized membrane protein YqjE